MNEIELVRKMKEASLDLNAAGTIEEKEREKVINCGAVMVRQYILA
jgi:hypothetical protein